MSNQKPEHVEIITSVDAEGEWDKGANVFHENCILNYGNGPDEHIMLGEIKGKLERLKKLEKLSSTPPVPKELLSWVKKTRKAYWRIGNKEHPEVYELEDAMLEAFEQLDSILPAVGEKE